MKNKEPYKKCRISRRLKNSDELQNPKTAAETKKNENMQNHEETNNWNQINCKVKKITAIQKVQAESPPKNES